MHYDDEQILKFGYTFYRDAVIIHRKPKPWTLVEQTLEDVLSDEQLIEIRDAREEKFRKFMAGEDVKPDFDEDYYEQWLFHDHTD